MTWQRSLILASALVALATPAASQQSTSWRYGISTGIDLSSGDYGFSQATDLRYLPVTLRLDHGNWTARMTLAHLRVSGPAGATTLGVGATRSRQSGPGDVVLALTRSSELALWGTTYLDLTAGVKLPTADEDRGLGTGAADYTLKLEAIRSVGAWTPFASIGYRVLGDAPDVALSNGLTASAGLDRRLGPHLNVGAILDWREPAAVTSDDALEIIPYLSWPMGRGITITGYATLGLAEGSPERGLGMQISYRSGR